MNDLEVLKRPFDIETHKKNFVNYLEVIVDEDGTVYYAVPSHQRKLLEIFEKKFNVKWKDIEDDIDLAIGCVDTLCAKTHCISVWFDSYIGEPNEIQREKLKSFKEHGIYNGPTKNIYEERRKYNSIYEYIKDMYS